MKVRKITWSNIIFVVVILLLIIPQTRQPIQVFIHKGLALFSPSIEGENNRKSLTNYNWQLEDILGNNYDFKQAEDKIILINLWATWCPPCIAEMPSLQKLYDDYNHKIEFLFVTNEKSEVVKQFLDKNNYSFNVLMPKSEYPKVFNVSSIPRTYLIDQKGNIIIDKSGAANWNSEKVRGLIDKLLIN